MSFDIVSIGEPMIEFNQTNRGEPAYLQGFGGDTSNTAIAAARQGAKVAYYTRLGEDAFGDLLLKLWAEEGVDASHVERDAAAFTGVYFVQHGPQGHVFHYLRAGSAASRMQAVPEALLGGARYVHASGISLAVAGPAVAQALRRAKQAGARISFDSNLRLKLWPLERATPAIAEAAALSDYFFPSLEDARALSGLDDAEAMLDWAHRLGAKNVFLKLGAGGVIASDGSRRVAIKGKNVRSVDATGAGDCFCGAALARLAAGDDVFAAARYANAAAALSTTGYGAVAPIPRTALVMQQLAAEDLHA
ncbi:MAG TPA: sugar kinase [Burkholderiales bacterium]|nr:sugar kinase [Burkholderiales bacterium]